MADRGARPGMLLMASLMASMKASEGVYVSLYGGL